MKIVKNKKLIEITVSDLNITSFKKVVIDLGTGDGRFVYKNALENPQNLYLGIDPSQSQLEIYSQKALKNKINNVFFILSSVEFLPDELKLSADELYVILPWGSLLQTLVKPNVTNLSDLFSLLKPEGELKILLGYDPDREPTEFTRLELPEINENYLKTTIIPVFKQNDLDIIEFKELDKKDLKNFESTWAKKLTFGKSRPLYYLHFKKRAE